MEQRAQAGHRAPSEQDMCGFQDVDHVAGQLYPYHFVARCLALGITKGTSATTFSPCRHHPGPAPLHGCPHARVAGASRTAGRLRATLCQVRRRPLP